jgi:hypothetical protein
MHPFVARRDNNSQYRARRIRQRLLRYGWACEGESGAGAAQGQSSRSALLLLGSGAMLGCHGLLAAYANVVTCQHICRVRRPALHPKSLTFVPIHAVAICRYRFFAGCLAQVEHEQIIEIFDPSSVCTLAEHLPHWQTAVLDTISYVCLFHLRLSTHVSRATSAGNRTCSSESPPPPSHRTTCRCNRCILATVYPSFRLTYVP